MIAMNFKVGSYYKLSDNETYIFRGRYQSIDEVPQIQCLFVIGNGLYKRKINQEKYLEYLSRLKSDYNRVSRENNTESRLLYLEVLPKDNNLMIIIKQLLKGYTINKFKTLFGGNVSEMNNFRRTIEQGGDLSYKRFAQLCEMLNKQINIIITDIGENPIISGVEPMSVKSEKPE